MYDVLFAPSRSQYSDEKKPDVECIFCAIRDKDPKVWTREIYRDDTVLVIMNIYPYSPGHLQIIPLRHITDIDELEKNETFALIDRILCGIDLTHQVMNPAGWNLGVNLGKSGASISHLHFQIVPRYHQVPQNDQEAIHEQLLRRTEIFEGGRTQVKEGGRDCNCLSGLEYLFEEDPFIYLSERPYNHGHVVVSPKKHVTDPRQLKTQELYKLFEGVKRAKRTIERVYEPVGINMGINWGEVPNSSEHLQIHIVPRFEPESGFMEVIAGTRVVVEGLGETHERLNSEWMDPESENWRIN